MKPMIAIIGGMQRSLQATHFEDGTLRVRVGDVGFIAPQHADMVLYEADLNANFSIVNGSIKPGATTFSAAVLAAYGNFLVKGRALTSTGIKVNKSAARESVD